MSGGEGLVGAEAFMAEVAVLAGLDPSVIERDTFRVSIERGAQGGVVAMVTAEVRIEVDPDELIYKAMKHNALRPTKATS